MKLTLTITDATQAEIIALLGGASGASITVATAPVSAPAAPSESDDEDDNAPAATVAPGEVDSAGIPYDTRIHSKNASKNKDGTWRKMKGVDAATVTAVEAELRARASGNTPVATPPAAPVNAPVTPPVSAPPAAAPAPVAAPPVAAPPAAPVTTPAALDFGGLMQIISNGMTANPPLITDEWISWLSGQVGVAQLPEIAADPAKIKQVYDLIKQHLPAMNLA